MSAALNKTAAEQASNETLIAEINRRLAAGEIDADDLHLPDFDDDEDVAAGGGMLPSEDELDWAALAEAQARFARKDYPDTLYHLEKALGRDFLGLGDLVLGRRT